MKRLHLLKQFVQAGLACGVLATTGCSMMVGLINDDYHELGADPFASASAADDSAPPELASEFDESVATEEPAHTEQPTAWAANPEFPNAEATTPPEQVNVCLLYTSPSPRDRQKSRMPSSA